MVTPEPTMYGTGHAHQSAGARPRYRDLRRAAPLPTPRARNAALPCRVKKPQEFRGPRTSSSAALSRSRETGLPHHTQGQGQNPMGLPQRLFGTRAARAMARVPIALPLLGFDPPLGVERRHAPRARRGDRLTVDVILHVPGSEDTLDRGFGTIVRDDVPGLVHLQFAF